MSESATAPYDEEVFSDELPDAALEIAGSKLWEGPAASFTAFILLRIGQLPDLSPEINAVYMKLGPVIRRPRFISPTRRQATAGPALSRPL